MVKKVLTIIVCLMMILGFSGCEKKNNKKDALEFKKEYESLNNKKTSSGASYRSVVIPEKNPFVKTTGDDIIKLLDDNKSFYLYVGDEMCPWCRSSIEMAIKVANNYSIKTIYYLEIWDEQRNEILRDKYEYKDNKLNKVVTGTKAYNELLKRFDSVLSDYNLKDENGKEISTGEKRIYAPNYFYIEKGQVQKMVEGYSSLQKDPFEDLTEEMISDEEKQFAAFFENNSACTPEGC